MKIEDGTGTGKLARVDSTNRLEVDAQTHSKLHDVSIDEGQVYMFSTGGFINMTTTDAKTGILYIKNDSATKFLIIHSIRTCGEQIQKVLLYKNSTTGTLISGATNGQVTNLNLASSNAPEATCYKGSATTTLTDGTILANHVNNIGHSTVKTEDALILGKNDSLSITFELATAGEVCVAVEGYFSVD